jgi:hypothetical protein
MSKAYFSSSIPMFNDLDSETILGRIVNEFPFDVRDTQRNAWNCQLAILKSQLSGFADGYILFEYLIPRMGKRADVCFLNSGIVFVLEFKVGETSYKQGAVDQVLDYAVDLKNFHEKSHFLPIVPILVATSAPTITPVLASFEDKVFACLKSNGNDLKEIVELCEREINQKPIDIPEWESSPYKPTPTIIEAAQALYAGHGVTEISRSEAGAINLTATSNAILAIVENAKETSSKAICFITGVPGAGKTLAGLNIANQRLGEKEQHAVFLSGNGPLVEVLREALARNDVASEKSKGNRVRKKDALRKAQAFIQNIHHFRDEYLSNDQAPVERVVVFDEAQRAWTLEQASSFMRRKKGNDSFKQSEPDYLIGVMNRHIGWAVIVCLIGGGQEINTGEAGLPEWFTALKLSYPNWQIHVSDQISDFEYARGGDTKEMLKGNQVTKNRDLHLAVSIRSFRSESVSVFVKRILDNQLEVAKTTYSELSPNFPILVTRNLETAKNWLRKEARGTERFGLLASSGALRLKTIGVYPKSQIDVSNWFLNDKLDVRSSFFLEDVATEFDIQGLELDWTCVIWDANLRFDAGQWNYYDFIGTKWQKIRNSDRMMFLKNAYRVLLTRARQGMVIVIPHGDAIDETRSPRFYDGTFQFLLETGIQRI